MQIIKAIFSTTNYLKILHLQTFLKNTLFLTFNIDMIVQKGHFCKVDILQV